MVSAYDLRPAAKEQVQSLGGRFVELPIEAKDAQDAGGYAKAQDEDFYRRQRELLAKVIAESDVVITAAVVPGKKSPVLVTEEMVAGMAPGSVIVDLAAERGGNCELTKPGEEIVATRRHDHRLFQFRLRRALPCEPDVRAQHRRVSHIAGQGRKAATQSRGRHHQEHAGDAGRGSGQRAQCANFSRCRRWRPQQKEGDMP